MKLLKSVQPAFCAPTPLLYRKVQIREVHPFAYASLLIHYGYYLRYWYRNFQNLFYIEYTMGLLDFFKKHF